MLTDYYFGAKPLTTSLTKSDITPGIIGENKSPTTENGGKDALFCFPYNSRCACGGMTTAETTIPPSNLGW